MFRVTVVSTIGLIGAVAANAGSVQIGGASGITANYINQGAGAVCAAGAGNCVAGSTTGWVERNYDNILFSGATSNSGATTPVPFTGYTQTGGTPSGMTATDTAGTTFAMLSDGVSSNGNSQNYWGSNGTNQVPVSITIPIGISGVTDLWTMMDNQWGTLGGNDATLTFNFGSSSTDTSGDIVSVAVPLLNSNNTNNSGDMRAAVGCLTTTTSTCNNSTNPHGTSAQNNVINGVTVNTKVVYNTFNYTAANPTGYYAGSAGTLKLDDQEFIFGSQFANDWLVSVTITENLGNTPASVGTTGNLPSELALSAITVDTVAPEPTSVLLLLSGFGAIGIVGARRRKKA
ncbi:MAG TPA: PEP-CTERM sorting domain-containing protein [Bryobacteraceae bacterium]|jgi:hypothetical protein|nr:PEP-CTERM sorting domain-containing protein [Bryobacteraceae bacterium]